ncbi:MAG TPA: hypothetical protein VN908_04425 [Gemmatimonadales bacterium]|nr:hypothetical protein [Gemmatimonadales bacterium]
MTKQSAVIKQSITEEHVAHLLADEREGPARRRLGAEQREQKRIAREEAQWTNPKTRAAIYRRYVLVSTLPDAVARLLCTLTVQWGHHLENSFPSYKKILPRLGGSSVRERKTLEGWLAHAVRTGWLERIPLTVAEDGELLEAQSHGRFVSAWGNRFCVPPGVVAPDHPGWKGPKVWTRRWYAQRATVPR